VTAVAERLVQGYLDDLRRVRAAVLSGAPEFGDSLKSVWTRIRAGELPRTGELPGGFHYRAHGAGCRFTDADDVEVDIDFTEDGVEMFDSWRVEMNARSRGFDDSVRREDLSSALAHSGQVTVVKDGWYTLVEA
jgi:hypothetical protein